MPKPGYKLRKAENTVYLKNKVEVVAVEEKYIDVLKIKMEDFYKVGEKKANGGGSEVDSYKVFNKKGSWTASNALTPTAGNNQKDLPSSSNVLLDEEITKLSLDVPADNSEKKSSEDSSEISLITFDSEKDGSPISPSLVDSEKDAVVCDDPSSSTSSLSIPSGCLKLQSVGSENELILKPSTSDSSSSQTTLSKRDCMLLDKIRTSKIRLGKSQSEEICKTSSIRMEEAPPIKSWRGVFGEHLLVDSCLGERKIFGVRKNTKAKKVKLNMDQLLLAPRDPDLSSDLHSDTSSQTSTKTTKSSEQKLGKISIQTMSPSKNFPMKGYRSSARTRRATTTKRSMTCSTIQPTMNWLDK